MTDTPDRPRLCTNGWIGCNKPIPESSMNRREHLCNSCITLESNRYGIHPSDIGWTATAGQNMETYFGAMPGSHILPYMEKARMLFMAAGVNVKDPTPREKDGAAYLKRKHPHLGAQKLEAME